MYKGQYGEYAYWCQGVKGLILCSLNNLKPENTPDHITKHNTIVGITFYRGRGFLWLVFLQNVSLYQVFFIIISK